MGPEWVGLVYMMLGEIMFTIYFLLGWYLSRPPLEAEVSVTQTAAPSHTGEKRGPPVPGGHKLMQAGRLLVSVLCRPQRRVLLDYH